MFFSDKRQTFCSWGTTLEEQSQPPGLSLTKISLLVNQKSSLIEKPSAKVMTHQLFSPLLNDNCRCFQLRPNGNNTKPLASRRHPQETSRSWTRCRLPAAPSVPANSTNSGSQMTRAFLLRLRTETSQSECQRRASPTGCRPDLKHRLKALFRVTMALRLQETCSTGITFRRNL